MERLPDRYIYPAVFHYNDDGISVYFPDLPGCLTFGENQEEAFLMARDVLAGYLAVTEEEGDPIPKPESAEMPALDASCERLLLIEAWMPPYRSDYAYRAVKKTVTLPRWLEEAAAERRVNFSRVLQEALMRELGIHVPRDHEEASATTGD